MKSTLTEQEYARRLHRMERRDMKPNPFTAREVRVEWLGPVSKNPPRFITLLNFEEFGYGNTPLNLATAVSYANRRGTLVIDNEDPRTMERFPQRALRVGDWITVCGMGPTPIWEDAQEMEDPENRRYPARSLLEEAREWSAITDYSTEEYARPIFLNRKELEHYCHLMQSGRWRAVDAIKAVKA